MVERFEDKQLRVLQKICSTDNSLTLTNDSVDMEPDDLWSILKYLENKNLLKIENNTYTSSFDGEQTNEGVSFDCLALNNKGLRKLFEQLKTSNPPKKEKPLITLKGLEIIAKKIGELDSGSGLVDFLKNNNVDAQLILYHNTKWKMVYDIFEYLSFSGKKEDNDLLLKLIEEAGHPLMFNGDKKKAEEAQDFFTGCMEYDGYCVYQGEVVKTSKEILEKIEKRKAEREAATNGFFGDKQTAPPQREIKLLGAEIKFDDNEPSVKINNQTVSLPPYRNEHYFCRSIFQRKKGEAVDWSIICTEMDKLNPTDTAQNKRMVQDTMYAINTRIKAVLPTTDDLFMWREKTITRQF